MRMDQDQIQFNQKNMTFNSKPIVLVKKMAKVYEVPYFCFVNSVFQKNYKALIKGGIVTLVLAIVLIKAGFIISNNADVDTWLYIAINAFGFLFCWLVLSFLIHKVSFYKVAGLVGLFVVITLTDRYLKIQFNPITIPLVILFWLGVTYLVLPQFFKKYQVAILAVYAVVISYYLFIFITTPNYGTQQRLSFVSFIVIPIPVFAALWIYEQWRWLRTLKADKGKAELALLKSQVNPHFFFNTLNNLYGLVVEKSAQAPEVVLKLSDMMRYTIYEGREDLVNLTDEVNYLESYIDLHKIRYQKKVDIQFIHDFDKTLQIAPLLFIILLENAFKHGVAPLTENAYIHLDLKARDNLVLFTIANNYEVNTPHQKAGIGLDNLKQRLAYSYPKRHELKIEKTATTYTVHLNLLLNP
ncbi:histidine kinase [Maribacter sp.]|nr:histidine kinase [Maribacter sp.]